MTPNLFPSRYSSLTTQECFRYSDSCQQTSLLLLPCVRGDRRAGLCNIFPRLTHLLSILYIDRISPCFPGCLAQYLISWFNILIHFKNFTLSLDIFNFLTFSHHENGCYFNTPNPPYLTKVQVHASPLLRLFCLCLASDFTKDSFIFQEHFFFFLSFP